MTVTEVRRLGGDTNAVIVQLPERVGPGIVLQYDSLNNVRLLVREIRAQLANDDRVEADGVINELDELLTSYLDVFDNLGPGGWAALKTE